MELENKNTNVTLAKPATIFGTTTESKTKSQTSSTIKNPGLIKGLLERNLKSNNKKGKRLFNTFFWGGYECAAPLGKDGIRLDSLKETRHDELISEDYGLLKDIGVSTVREGLNWSVIDKNGDYDFSRFEEMMRVGKEEGVQQIWDLNHFDYPEDLDPFSEEFVERFTSYAREAVKVIRKYQSGTLFIVPINEIGFYAYMGGKVGLWPPFLTGRDRELRKNLVRASISAIDAIWEVDKDVQFIQVDPIEYWKLKPNATEEHKASFEECLTARYEAWDMICGKKSPELGGDPKYLQLIGVNYYFQNQKMVEGDPLDADTFIPMDLEDENRICLAEMLKEVYDRYGCPIIITETGSYEPHRSKFWTLTLAKIEKAMDMGVDILGVCAYPVIDRLDWHDGHVTNSGLWDFEANDFSMKRIPNEATLNVVRKYIEKWKIYNRL